MALTRNVPNIGTPENMFMSGSTTGSIKGCSPQKNANIGRYMVGGEYVGSAHDTTIPMGPKGGLVGHTSGTSCGVTNPLNLDASSQMGGNYSSLAEGNAAYGFDSAEATQGLPGGAFSYPPISSKPQMSCQTGGSKHKVCNDVQKINSYEQVHGFWSYICPGAVFLYKKHVKKQSKHAIPFIRHYTRAFCEEVNALQAKTDAKRVKHLAKYRRHMKNAEHVLHKMNRSAHDDHMIIVKRHENRILEAIKSPDTKKKHMKHTPKHKTQRKRKTSYKGGKISNKKSRKSRSHSTKKHHNKMKASHSSRRQHKRHTHKNMKHHMKHHMKGGSSAVAGYHQFNSNVPRSPGYGLQQGSMPSGGLLANPMPYQANNNCNDVYNHYTGVNSEAPARI